MKNFTLLTSFVLISLFCSSQCDYTIDSWVQDGQNALTVTVTLSPELAALNIINLNTGLFQVPNAQNQLTHTFTLPDAPNSVNWLPLGAEPGCAIQASYTTQQLVYFTDFTTSSPTICGGCDGSICSVDPSWDFTVDGVASINGCVSGLCTDSYLIDINGAVGTIDGAPLFVQNLEVEVPEAIQILYNPLGQIEVIYNGSNNFNYNIESLFNSSFDEPLQVGTNPEGCVEVTITDIENGCSITVNQYVPFNLYQLVGDFNGDGCANADDLLSFLGIYGSFGPVGDFDCNGLVNAADLINFLAYFGTGPTCNN